MPKSYNYIGAFLTFRCNLGCDYCLNKQGDFLPRPEMSGKRWIEGLEQLETREDLPITFQGGEPTLHKDFYEIAYQLHKKGKKLDLLTNGEFDIEDFIDNVSPDTFRRKAPYASIRFSFHKNTDENKLIDLVTALYKRNYSVGIWGLNIPDMEKRNKIVAGYCKDLGLDYREKEFLDETHGTYKYPVHLRGTLKECMCKPSELLIAPDGLVYRCHRDLYGSKGAYDHISHSIKPMVDFERCWWPKCNPCDVKLKTNRLQQGGHCSVEIQ
jgi:hypothetical protein